jgi:ABC-2 type transport system permease protein
MTFVRETRLFFLRKMRETLRKPVWIVVDLSTPLLYLALFAPLLKSFSGGPGFRSGRILDVFVPGILTLLAFSAGTGAGYVVILELNAGVVERLRVTPASRFALLVGTVLRDVVMLWVPALLVVLIAIPLGFHPHWPGIVLLFVLLGLLTASVSAWSGALGLLLKDIGSLAAVVTGLQLPLALLSGVLLPLSLAPAWMLTLAHFNPLYYAVDAARDLGAGTISSVAVGQGYLVMTGLAMVVLWWATRTYQRAVA